MKINWGLLVMLFFLFACGNNKPTPIDKETLLQTPIGEIPKSSKLGSYDDIAGVNTTEYDVGGKVIDNFVYYDLEGNQHDLYSTLKLGKPILFVAGSYSCPVFRRRFQEIEQYKEWYGNEIEFMMVYTAEAHPFDVPSPYRDTIWVHRDNWKEKVFINESKTMADRIKTAGKFAKDYDIQSTVGIDGPDNHFWKNYGQMPAFAYLIGTDKKIKAFHEWVYPPDFNKHIYELRKEIMAKNQ